jgi:hypothetical protein
VPPNPSSVSEFNLFPTKVVSIQFRDTDDLNQELYQLFETSPVFRGDAYNTVSDHANLVHLEKQHACIARLREMFVEGLQQWLRSEQIDRPFDAELHMFPNLSRQGDFTQVHNHAAHVASVYYVRTSSNAVGGPSGPLTSHAVDGDYWSQDNGVLYLHDPRFNANLASLRNDDYVKFAPRPGQMLLFPAYLWHSVSPHRDPYRRAAISCNFTLKSINAEPPYRVAVHK